MERNKRLYSGRISDKTVIKDMVEGNKWRREQEYLLKTQKTTNEVSLLQKPTSTDTTAIVTGIDESNRLRVVQEKLKKLHKKHALS